MANPLHEQIIKEAKEQLQITGGTFKIEYEVTKAGSSYENEEGIFTGTLRDYRIIHEGARVGTYRIFTCGKPVLIEGKIIPFRN